MSVILDKKMVSKNFVRKEITKDTIFLSIKDIHETCGYDVWKPQYFSRLKSYRINRLFNSLGKVTLELYCCTLDYFVVIPISSLAADYVTLEDTPAHCEAMCKKYCNYFLDFASFSSD